MNDREDSIEVVEKSIKVGGAVNMYNHDQHLRTVHLNGYELTTWDTYRTDHFGKSILGYRLTNPSGLILFEAEDFGCSPLHPIDSDESLRGILTFLCLRPGDTDAEYFENYTPEQMDFANGDAESLSLYTLDDGDVRFEI